MKTPAFLLALLGTIPAMAAPDAPLRFSHAQVEDVLIAYGKLIGKRIIAANTVQGQINLVTDEPVTPEVAAGLIEKSLFLNGFSLIDADEDTVEVLGLGMAVHGAPVYKDPADFPKAERIFSYIYKTQRRDPKELVVLLSQHLHFKDQLNLVSDSTSSTLLMTGPSTVIRGTLQVLAALDTVSNASSTGAEQDPSAQQAATPPQKTSVTPAPARQSPAPFILR